MDDDEDEDEEESDDDTADDDNSIDPELAREKFAELRTQYEVTRDTIKAKGRSHAAAQEEILNCSRYSNSSARCQTVRLLQTACA